MVRSAITLLSPPRPDVELAPAYWRLLVARVPRIAADHLARDIRTRQFRHDRLLARIGDLLNHARARVRERARSELLPALALTRDETTSIK